MKFPVAILVASLVAAVCAAPVASPEITAAPIAKREPQFSVTSTSSGVTIDFNRPKGYKEKRFGTVVPDFNRPPPY